MIGIIDYGMGNLGSVTNAFRFLGVTARILSDPDEMSACRGVILPGVGAFGDCVAHLAQYGFVEPVREWIRADRPFLGICLGLHLLFEGSDESPGVSGLGILPGRIRRFAPTPEWKVPQIGWNRVRQNRPDCPLFRDIPEASYFYFVHSFYTDVADRTLAAGLTDYGLEYTSVVWRGNMMAAQFHPEKSQKMGLQMLRNFALLVEGDGGTK